MLLNNQGGGVCFFNNLLLFLIDVPTSYSPPEVKILEPHDGRYMFLGKSFWCLQPTLEIFLDSFVCPHLCAAFLQGLNIELGFHFLFPDIAA